MTIYLDGSYNAATGTRDAFAGLSAELVALGHPEMRVTEGDRERATQEAIWNERMVPAGEERGRRVYRRVWWNGLWWSQIHPWAVAPPGGSNHEGRRSNDLAYPYNDRSTAAHQAAQRLAPKYGITWEGANFDEDWHWTFWGVLGRIGTPAGTGNSTVITRRKKKSMVHAAYRNDGNSFAIQQYPDGPLRWIKGGEEWGGVMAANPGLYGYQVSDAWLAAQFAKFGEVDRYAPPATSVPSIITVIGDPTQYTQIGGVLVALDAATARHLVARGAVAYAISAQVRDELQAG